MDEYPDDDEPIPRAPEEHRFQHKTEVGEMVFNALGKDAPPLMYVEANRFVTRMLTEGRAWWWTESELKKALSWVAKKRANHAGLRTLLNKIAKS